jgi:hypothetical protein
MNVDFDVFFFILFLIELTMSDADNELEEDWGMDEEDEKVLSNLTHELLIFSTQLGIAVGKTFLLESLSEWKEHKSIGDERRNILSEMIHQFPTLEQHFSKADWEILLELIMTSSTA